MTIRKMINKKTTAAVLILTTVMALLLPEHTGAGTAYTGDPDQYTLWRSDISDGVDFSQINRNTPFHFDFETNGNQKASLAEVRVLPRGADRIWWDTPQVGHCSSCEEAAKNPDLYSCRIFLEDDAGREYYSKSGVELTKEDLAASGINFDTLRKPIRIGIEILQKPGVFCTSCNRHVGDVITVDNLTIHYPLIEFSMQPSSVTVSAGESATFEVGTSKYIDIAGREVSQYKWVVRSGDTWVELSDGIGSDGALYQGTDTPRMTVGSINSSMHETQYCCKLRGIWSRPVYSQAATVSLPQPTSVPDPDPDPVPTVIPPSPTPSPTTAPPSPTTTPPLPTSAPPSPTGVPSRTPTPTPYYDPAQEADPIRPGGGGSSSYAPSASTTSIVPGGSSSSTGKTGPSSSTSVTGPGGGTGGGGTYSGTLGTSSIPALSGTDNRISAADPGDVSAGKGGTKRDQNGTSKKGGTGGSSKSTAGSTVSSGSKRSSSGYVMRNGVLYIIDDDNGSIKADTTGAKDADTDVITEEKDQEYSASDLAVDGKIREQDLKKGFFHTAAGRLVIVGIALLILLLLLLVLFFGVIVFGEVEEHDEVFELCAIRLMMRREGNWHVRLGESFDENAVIKLRIGLLFALIFEDWELTGEVKGMYEGEITGQIQQGMLMHRKDIRRSV